jgi:multisubunit Na+/H+ antiporter MnhB subunit
VSQNLIKRWSLSVFCSLFYATFSFVILFIWSPDGFRALRSLAHSRSSIQQLVLIALAAGVCTIATGIWNVREANSWLLVLNGLACSALGIMVALGASRPITFRSIALAIVVMAVSLGLYELVAAKTLRGHRVDEWLLTTAGAVSVGFAGVFLGFVLGWIRLEPSPSAQTFHWLGSYFGFSSICMLGLAWGYFRPPSLPII